MSIPEDEIPLPRRLVPKCQARERLGLSDHTFRSLIRDGHLTARRLGRRVMIEEREIERFLDAIPVYQGPTAEGSEHGRKMRAARKDAQQ